MKLNLKNILILSLSIILLIELSIQAQLKLSNLNKLKIKHPTEKTKEVAPKVCGRSVGNIPQSQEWIPNTDLDYLPEAVIKKHTLNTKCTIFSGLIYMVEKANSYDKELKLVQIYVKADSSKIDFYQSLEPQSQFHEVTMKNFIKIGQNFKGTTCFDIVSSSQPSADKPFDTKDKRGSLTLCTLKVKEEQNWVRGLLDLKECTQGKGHFLADFSSVNQSIEKAKEEGNKHNPSVSSNTSFYYTNGGGVYESYSPIKHEIGKITVTNKYDAIGRATEAIQETIKESTLKAVKVKKELAKKLMDVKKTHTAVVKKKEILQRLIESREQVEKQHHETILKQEHDNRQLSILKKANEEIKKVKDGEIEQVKKSFEDKIKKEKKKANEKAANVLRCMKNEQKDKDPAECLDEKVQYFDNKDHIKSLCYRFYGEVAGAKCEDKSHFCDMCCSHFIGIKFAKKVESCKNNCSTKINEKRIEYAETTIVLKNKADGIQITNLNGFSIVATGSDSKSHNAQLEGDKFVLSHLPEGEYTLAITAQGWLTTGLDLKKSLKAKSQLEYSLTKEVYKTSVKLKDSNGNSITHINISITATGIDSKIHHSEQAGDAYTFKGLEEGEYTLSITAPGYNLPTTQPKISVSKATANQSHDITLTKETYSISGSLKKAEDGHHIHNLTGFTAVAIAQDAQSKKYDAELNGQKYVFKDLPEGEYNFIISGPGFNTLNARKIVDKPIDWEPELVKKIENFNITAKFKNAINGEYITEVNGFAILAKDESGIAKNGEMKGNQFTLKDLSEGEYEFSITAPGWIDSKMKKTVNRLNVNDNGYFDFVLSQELKITQYRIVMTWGSIPQDLDSRLYLRNGEEISFMHKESNGKIAKLDTDQVKGFGPETITVDILPTGNEVDKYYVLNYSQQADRNAPNITRSNAKVIVYNGSKEIKSYSVPESGIGLFWHVFDITKDGIKDVNAIVSKFGEIEYKGKNKYFHVSK